MTKSEAKRITIQLEEELKELNKEKYKIFNELLGIKKKIHDTEVKIQNIHWGFYDGTN